MNKRFNQVRAFAHRHMAKAAAGTSLLLLSTMSRAGVIGDMLDSISLDTEVVAIGALLLIVIGIALSFKGVDVSKRVIRKV